MRFNKELEQLWEFRHSRELEKCRNGWAVLRKNARPQWLPHLQLLEVSLLRADGKMEESEKLLESLSEGKNKFVGRWEFQRGLNAFGAGEYARAWPHFQKAKQMLKNPYEQVMALCNLIGCRDALGLDFEQQLAELEKAAIILEKYSAELAAALQPQILTLKMRLQFRAGDFNALHETASKSPAASQARFFQHWAQNLPYANNVKAPALDPAQFPTYLYQFRMNTVLGKLEKNIPMHEVRTTELVDRIYLWVWKWLEGHEAFPLGNIIPLVSALESGRTATTYEDFLLLRNALGWLDLLGQSKSSAALLPKFTMLGEAPFPLFELEYLLIQYWGAWLKENKVDSEKLKISIEAHPLFTLPGLAFGNFLSPAKSFSFFRRRLEFIKRSKSEQPGTIYPEKNLLLNHQGKRSQNEDLCRLAQLSLESPSLKFSAIALQVWGLRRYEPAVHEMKIFRLAQKLRDFFGDELNVRTKNAVMHLDWQKKPMLVDQSEIGVLPQDFFSWNALSRPVPEKKSAVTKELAGIRKKTKIRREELENELGCSKATAARWIKIRVESGELLAVGRGKKIHYEWKNLI